MYGTQFQNSTTFHPMIIYQPININYQHKKKWIVFLNSSNSQNVWWKEILLQMKEPLKLKPKKKQQTTGKNLIKQQPLKIKRWHPRPIALLRESSIISVLSDYYSCPRHIHIMLFHAITLQKPDSVRHSKKLEWKFENALHLDQIKDPIIIHPPIWSKLKPKVNSISKLNYHLEGVTDVQVTFHPISPKA